MKMFESPKWEITQSSEKLNKQLFGSKSERKKLKTGPIGPSPERNASNTYKEESQEKIDSSINAPSKRKKKKRKKTSIENEEGSNFPKTLTPKILSGKVKHKKTENLLGNKLSKSQKKRLRKKKLQENKISNEKSSPNTSQNVDEPKKLHSQENSHSSIYEKDSHAKKKKKHQSLQNSPISDEGGDSGIERPHLKPVHKKKLTASFKTSKQIKQNGAVVPHVVSSKLTRRQRRNLKRKAALQKNSSTASDSISVGTQETGSDLSDISKLKKKKKKNKLNSSIKQDIQNPDSESPSGKTFKGSNSTSDEHLKNISVGDVTKVEDASNVSKKKKKKRKKKRKSNLAESAEVSTAANLNNQKSEMQSSESKSSKRKKRKHLLDSNMEVDHKKQKFSDDSAIDKGTESSPLSSKKKRKHSIAVDVESINDTHKMKKQKKDSSVSKEANQILEDSQTESPSQNKMKKKRRRRKKKEEIPNTDGELESPGPQPNPSSKSPHFIQKLKQIMQNQQNTNSSVAKQQKKDGQTGNLREKMMNRLQASRFRYLNEQLYSCEGKDALKLFRSDPDSFKAYHEGYQQQVSQWPLNPLDKIIKSIKKKSDSLVIADFGCGDARLAKSVPNKVHSFDLMALSEEVTACDMAHTPLDPASVDIAVFCLSLMGTNLSSYILEANRVLKEGGLLKIAEVESRFENVDGFIKDLTKFGFVNSFKDLSHNLFYFMDFRKQSSVKYSNKLPQLSLKPCLYKKR